MQVRRLSALLCAGAVGLGALSACSSEESDGDVTAHSVDDARNENRSRQVDERFGDKPKVIKELDGSGIETSQEFFEKSETAIFSADNEDDELRAASLAVVTHAPMVRVTDPGAAKAELDRLGAQTVLLVGDVPEEAVSGINAKTVTAPTTAEGMGKMTSLSFETKDVATVDRVSALAELESDHPELITSTATDAEASPPDDANEEAAQAEEITISETAGPEAVESEAPEANATGNESEQVTDPESFPVQSERDGNAAPIVVAYPETPLAAAANARAFGAEVRVIDYPDPRVNDAALKMVTGLSDKPLIGLGRGFGSDEALARKIELAETNTAELPGGGHLLFPGRRMIALYGHHSGPALGVMGEYSPEDAVAHVQELVNQYQEVEPNVPVIPAFEIIATVASDSPGDDGDYSNEADPADLKPYIDAVVNAGGYAVIDLQPGRADLLDQAKLYEDLLKEPNVGLALDPEWKIGPDEVPLSNVGHVEAGEVNRVSQWLADLTRENELPQKAFVLHQFQLQMLRDREQIRTDHPELAFVLHADGHGVPEQKFDTWNVMRQDLDPNWFMAWKNFIDEDDPTFTPEQTYQDVNPRPWFVSYQ